MRQGINRLLVFRIGQIGDSVAALPSLWVLRQQFPEARIVVLSEIPARKTHLPPETVLPKAGLVDGFEKYPSGASAKHFFAAWRQIHKLRNRGFTTLVYLVPSGRTKRQRLRDRFFFRLCGINHLLAAKGFSENPHPRLFDGSLAPLPKEADALLHRLSLDGLPVPALGKGCMDLRITAGEREGAGDYWQKYGYSKIPRRRAVICTGGKASSQLWPWKRYAEVLRLLIRENGVFPVIVGGAQDREVAGKLLDHLGTGLCAAGELAVRESVALMEGAQFYLGNNTGVMHLAAAIGVPCVAVSSARDWPGIWEPYGIGHKVLRHDVPCSGCQLEICDKELQCLRGVQVEQVYEACTEVIKQAGESRKFEN